MKKIFGLLIIISCFAALFSSCEKDYSIEHNNTQSASGSLWDSTGNCLPDTVIGTFYNGVTPGSDTAYVEMEVNVTQTGSYNITTGVVQNGLIFYDSGFFANTGINTIRLKPIGTPILNTSTTYTVSFDSSVCTFTINVHDSTGTGLGGGQDTTGTGGGTDSTQNSWQFTQGPSTYAGSIDSATKDNSAGLATAVHLSGTSSTGDTSMSIDFVIPATDIQTGTYTMFNNGITFSAGDFLNDFSYSANAFITGASFTIVVTNYDATTRTMQGTFSGNAQDKSGSIVPIINGSFTAVVE